MENMLIIIDITQRPAVRSYPYSPFPLALRSRLSICGAILLDLVRDAASILLRELIIERLEVLDGLGTPSLRRGR